MIVSFDKISENEITKEYLRLINEKIEYMLKLLC